MAFGRLINQFGQTETTLAFHLEEYALGLLGGGFGEDELRIDILRAFIGSKRTKDLVTSFNDCKKAWAKAGRKYEASVQAEIKELFAQLEHIRFLRDRTAHYGVQPRGENGKIYFRAINRYTVKDLEKTEEILFVIEHLDAASDDLETICRRLPFALGMHKRGRNDLTNPETLPPWRYKPSELVKRPWQYQPNPQRPAPPQTAWWE